jgi:hypothetical protein
MIEGLAYVRHNQLVLGAITLDLFAVLLGGATAMLPVYARDILMVGPEGWVRCGRHRHSARRLPHSISRSGRSRRTSAQDAGGGGRIRRGDRRVRSVHVDAAVTGHAGLFWARPTCSRSTSASH